MKEFIIYSLLGLGFSAAWLIASLLTGCTVIKLLVYLYDRFTK